MVATEPSALISASLPGASTRKLPVSGSMIRLLADEPRGGLSVTAWMPAWLSDPSVEPSAFSRISAELWTCWAVCGPVVEVVKITAWPLGWMARPEEDSMNDPFVISDWGTLATSSTPVPANVGSSVPFVLLSRATAA